MTLGKLFQNFKLIGICMRSLLPAKVKPTVADPKKSPKAKGKAKSAPKGKSRGKGAQVEDSSPGKKRPSTADKSSASKKAKR